MIIVVYVLDEVGIQSCIVVIYKEKQCGTTSKVRNDIPFIEEFKLLDVYLIWKDTTIGAKGEEVNWFIV